MCCFDVFLHQNSENGDKHDRKGRFIFFSLPPPASRPLARRSRGGGDGPGSVDVSKPHGLSAGAKPDSVALRASSLALHHAFRHAATRPHRAVGKRREHDHQARAEARRGLEVRADGRVEIHDVCISRHPA